MPPKSTKLWGVYQSAKVLFFLPMQPAFDPRLFSHGRTKKRKKGRFFSYSEESAFFSIKRMPRSEKASELQQQYKTSNQIQQFARMRNQMVRTFRQQLFSGTIAP